MKEKEVWSAIDQEAGERPELAEAKARLYPANMTADAIIEEIKHLPPSDQADVIKFAIRLAGERALTGDELTRLAQRMVESNNPAEVERLRSAITEGFYGTASHA